MRAKKPLMLFAPTSLNKVDEKFGKQIFRVFSEMRWKILYYNPTKLKNLAKIIQKANKIWKSGSENPIPKFEIGVSKPLTLNQKIAFKNLVPNPKIDIWKP